MKNLLVGLLAVTSFSAFSQGIEMKITNENYPSRSIILTCLDEDCTQMNVKTPRGEKIVDQTRLTELSKKKLKRENGWDEYPFSFVATSYKNAERDFEYGDVGNGIGNSIVTILAVPADIFLLPMKASIYLTGKRDGIEGKRASKKLLKFIKTNESVDVVIKDYQFQKITNGLDLL